MKSWLLTIDHKRIAILYLIGVTVFFALGGLVAALIRLELLTPAGDVFQAETYNKIFTTHGVMMVFFFMIPAIPAVLGNFLMPLMIGAKDLAFPRLNLLSWYLYIIGGADRPVGGRPRRRRHRLDVLHAVLDGLLERLGRRDGGRRLHRRVLLDPHGPELPRDDPHDARAGHDAGCGMPLFCWGIYATSHHPDPRHAGHRDHGAAAWRRSGSSTSASSIRRRAATRCSSSTSSGSTRTRPSTS